MSPATCYTCFCSCCAGELLGHLGLRLVQRCRKLMLRSLRHHAPHCRHRLAAGPGRELGHHAPPAGGPGAPAPPGRPRQPGRGRGAGAAAGRGLCRGAGKPAHGLGQARRLARGSGRAAAGARWPEPVADAGDSCRPHPHPDPVAGKSGRGAEGRCHGLHGAVHNPKHSPGVRECEQACWMAQAARRVQPLRPPAPCTVGWQGPPGTGKTRTLLGLLEVLARTAASSARHAMRQGALLAVAGGCSRGQRIAVGCREACCA